MSKKTGNYKVTIEFILYLFFICQMSYFIRSTVLLIFCVLVRRATSFSILNLSFFLGNEVRSEGTVPPIVGGVED
jgi:Na+/H+ antiporter NhaB